MNSFTQTILHWYAENGRDLPWRRSRDPYAVWLSEIILQQTRIAQGTAYWERFLQRFPTVQDLASASEDQVLRLWEGLGYYSRARNLYAAARQIVARGSFPDTLESIRSLKGVGDYTAAAIGSICFGLPAAVVDGNVYRVLARHFGVETPVGTTAAKKEFTALAQKLLPADSAAFNQGMMDFGALVCTPVGPSCPDCPLQASCNAFRTGRVALLPLKKPAAKPVERHFSYVYVRFQGQTAIRRRGPGDIWQGLWEPLVSEADTEVCSASAINLADADTEVCSASAINYADADTEVCSAFAKNYADAAAEHTSVLALLPASAGSEPDTPSVGAGGIGKNIFRDGTRKTIFPEAIANLTHTADGFPVLPGLTGHLQPLRTQVRHQLTHRTLIADFYLWEPSARPALPEGYIWVPEAELDRYAKPRLFQLLLSAL